MYILKSYLSLKSYTITNQSRDALDKILFEVHDGHFSSEKEKKRTFLYLVFLCGVRQEYKSINIKDS